MLVVEVRDFTPAPRDPTWGSFSELDDRNKKVLREILEAAAKSPGAPGSNHYKLGTFYSSCMDSARVEAEGPRPIGEELARIAALQTSADVQGEIARLHRLGVRAAFDFYARQDFKNSTQYIAVADQG